MSVYVREASVLDWDTEHFEKKIGSFGPASEEDIAGALQWARDQQVKMLMARCDVVNLPVIHGLERAGFLLMDTFVRYAFRYSKKQIPEDTGQTTVRSFTEDDIEAIGRVAERSFVGYKCHFHNDSVLDTDRCNQVHIQWAQNSCREKRLADDVLVAESEGRILGFATLKGLDDKAAEGILFGVDPDAQGMGIYRSFMIQGMHWCKDRGFQVMEVDSQVNNYPVQRVWERLGFEIFASGHTFHLHL